MDSYKKLFDPDQPAAENVVPDERRVADSRDGGVYVYAPEIVLAVNVALATGRPLLVRGPSGSGKSSLARAAAQVLGWRYYEVVVTSRTQARDLLWEVDLLRRLHDAQLRDASFSSEITPYLKPGVLWWALDNKSAERRGKEGAGILKDPSLTGGSGPRAVVLIDEIDKAEPDVPNNLLVPLGSLQFQVEETGVIVKAPPELAPLIFITSNGERDLPAAFLRRCIELPIDHPSPERLIDIGLKHFPSQTRESLSTYAEALRMAQNSGESSTRVGAAEFLDTVRACVELGIGPDSETWDGLVRMALLKRGEGAG